LTRPKVHIITYDSIFNFSDLIPPLDTSSIDTTEIESEALRFQLGNILVKGLSLKYTDQLQQTLFIDSLDVEIDPINWNQQLLSGQLFISLLKGGELNSSFEANLTDGDYQSNVDINEIVLHQFSHLLRPHVNIEHIDGTFSNHISVKGNFLSDTTDLKLKGNIRIDNFRLLDSHSIEQVAFDSLYFDIDSIDLKSNQYRLNQVVLNSLSINYALYPNTDSFSALLYPEDSTSAIPEPVQLIDTTLIVGDTTSVYYSINKAAITNTTLAFEDFTLLNNFAYSIDAINITTDSLDSSAPQSELNISALLNYKGVLKTKINFDLDDLKNFAYQATIDSVSMQDFSPYSLQFVGNPITKGMLSFDGHATTSAHFLKSENDLILDQLKLGGRIKHDESYNLPVKTAVSLLKNKKGEIKIKLPIRGNLDDPSFKIGPTVLNTLKNLVVKTVTSPLTVVGKFVTSENKNINEIPYQFLQTSFNDHQISLIESIEKRIKNTSEGMTTIIQYTNPPKEKAGIAIFEAKKKYYKMAIDSVGFSKKNALQITLIDSAFQVFVNREISLDSVMSLNEKCATIVGEDVIEEKFMEIVNARNQALQQLLGNNDRIIIQTGNYQPAKLRSHRPVFKIVE
jgi:hypothetical protein